MPYALLFSDLQLILALMRPGAAARGPRPAPRAAAPHRAAARARPSCARASQGRAGSPGPAGRSVRAGPAPPRGDRATADHTGCPRHHGRAEAVPGVRGGAQGAAGPLSPPRSARGGVGPPRGAAVGAGNVPDANGRRDDGKRQKRSHHTEPVPTRISADIIWNCSSPASSELVQGTESRTLKVRGGIIC